MNNEFMKYVDLKCHKKEYGWHKECNGCIFEKKCKEWCEGLENEKKNNRHK